MDFDFFSDIKRVPYPVLLPAAPLSPALHLLLLLSLRQVGAEDALQHALAEQQEQSVFFDPWRFTGLLYTLPGQISFGVKS